MFEVQWYLQSNLFLVSTTYIFTGYIFQLEADSEKIQPLF